jgi:isopenicillin-N epimerase
MADAPPPLPGARDLFELDPDVAHLNHGSFGATPAAVRAARRVLIDEHDRDPLQFVTQGLAERLTLARRALGDFVGAPPGSTALVANATTGTALVLHSLGLEAGDEIVVTDHGYAAVMLAVHELRARLGVRVVTVGVPLRIGPDGDSAGADDADSTDDATVAAVLGAVTARTRLVIVDQVSSATAQAHPVRRLADELRPAGVPLLVDAAHAPGMLPDPAGIGADFWVGNLHKWGFAPAGAALLAVSEPWRNRMVPWVVSHAQPAGFPSRLESQGTRDYSPWLAAPTGLELFERYGAGPIRRHNEQLARYGQQVIAHELGLPADRLPEAGPGISMRLLPLPRDSETAYDQVWAESFRDRIRTELSTWVNVFGWNGRGYLRISAQIYNEPAEYERLAIGLRRLLG